MDQRVKIRQAMIFYNIGISILLLFIFLSIFFFLPYIHESGHVIFGYLNNLLFLGKTGSFQISNWMQHPFFKMFSFPQQTKPGLGDGSANFVIGGPALMMCLFLVLSSLGYFRSKRKVWFILFLSIAIFEVYGDIICGTDNFINNPLSICISFINGPVQIFAALLFSGTLVYLTMTSYQYKLFLRRIMKNSGI